MPSWLLMQRRSPRPTRRVTTARCCCGFRGCSSWRCGNLKMLASRAVALRPHLGGDRAGVADVLDVIDLVTAVERVEVAREYGVAVEVEQAAFLRDQEAEIAAAVGVGDLPERLVL